MIRTVNLTKKFGEFTAVDGVSLVVKEGSIFAFLGHNGAGKTTLISMLTTLLLPTGGSAEIDGMDVARENLKVRSIIGYLPENISLYGDLTAAENLKFFGRLSGIERVEERVDKVLQILNFMEWKNQKVKTFSKGMRQRIGIAQSILHEPKVLFLDEPTSGLDPQGTRELQNILLKLNKEFGTTIFMNTHMLSEATKICTDIGIISRGKLLLTDSIADLKRHFSDAKSLEEIYFSIERGDGVETNHADC